MSGARGVVVVTGTTRGIGRHLAEAFLDRGDEVVGVNRTRAHIDRAGYTEILADLQDRTAVAAACRKLAPHRVRGLINNAGIHGPIGAFATNDLHAWFETFEVNLFAPAAITQACVPSLRREYGFVIFLSGGGSGFPRPNFSAYGVSKTGVVRLSEVLARELAPDVLVYCVAPGPNRTELLDEAIKHGEPVPKEDVVDFEYPERLCLFLAENRDARYSGRFIHVQDNYAEWGQTELSPDAYTLRRLKT